MSECLNKNKENYANRCFKTARLLDNLLKDRYFKVNVGQSTSKSYSINSEISASFPPLQLLHKRLAN